MYGTHPCARSFEEKEGSLAVRGSKWLSSVSRMKKQNKQNNDNKRTASFPWGPMWGQISAPPLSSLWMCGFERTVGRSVI